MGAFPETGMYRANDVQIRQSLRSPFSPYEVEK